MIRIDDGNRHVVRVGTIPKPGWSGRRRARALQALKAVAAAVLFIGLLVEAFVFLWLLAPEGAAYPR